MSNLRTCDLSPGYSSEVEGVDEKGWYQILNEFEDANIYQTWAYGAVRFGLQNMSHLILRKDGHVAAVAQARIVKLPLINFGIAYVRWGPLWKRSERERDLETFRQTLRALRNEYTCRRGLVLRIFPVLFDDDSPCFKTILAEEGFSPSNGKARERTIVMDIAPPLEALRKGMRKNWKENLKRAERNGLQVVEGSDDNLFHAFMNIYKEMLARKRFAPGLEVDQFRSIQAQLPEQFKMKIALCRSGEWVCAGLVWSALGNTGVSLLAATSNSGAKSRGSYLLRWKFIERLKQSGIAVYNMGGINPKRNPGTYKFKSDLAGENGKDVYCLGYFDSHRNSACYSFIKLGDSLRALYRILRQLAEPGHLMNWQGKAVR
jgi:hypothetical protein